MGAEGGIPLTPFWFLRHGETDWNARGLSQGNVDIPLNAVGRAQAERAAVALQGLSTGGRQIATILASGWSSNQASMAAIPSAPRGHSVTMVSRLGAGRPSSLGFSGRRLRQPAGSRPAGEHSGCR